MTIAAEGYNNTLDGSSSIEDIVRNGAEPMNVNWLDLTFRQLAEDGHHPRSGAAILA